MPSSRATRPQLRVGRGRRRERGEARVAVMGDPGQVVDSDVALEAAKCHMEPLGCACTQIDRNQCEFGERLQRGGRQAGQGCR